ncbi:MAG: hypothetical protein AB7G75_11835 [Candidatus Binatia bacterium]
MKIEEVKLSQLQTISRLIALVSFAVFVAFIAFGAWQLRRINQEIDDRKTELTKLNAEIKKKEEEIQARDAIINNTPKPIIEKALEDNPAVAKSLPRIYLHIGEESQREGAKNLAKKLQAEGYLVPGIEDVGNKAGKEIELRYCENKGQATDVDHIHDLLTREGIAVAKARVLTVQNVPSCKNVSMERNYELWLGSDFTNYE